MKLTKAEEEIMHYIWDLGPCTVSQILEQMPPPPPPHSSVSTIVRILEKKGYLTHKSYGRTYEYKPLISREEYGRKSLRELMDGYFSGSARNLVSFLMEEEKVDKEALLELLKSHSDND
jgi:BlaI family transcriptional regulator, penicillinase repressor